MGDVVSAAVLREAAALMRERATAALPANPAWVAYELPDAGPDQWTMVGIGVPDDDQGHRAEAMFREDAEHIASWHPTVALAVARFLNFVAPFGDNPPEMFAPTVEQAVNIAHAYLGTTTDGAK